VVETKVIGGGGGRVKEGGRRMGGGRPQSILPRAKRRKTKGKKETPDERRHHSLQMGVAKGKIGRGRKCEEGGKECVGEELGVKLRRGGRKKRGEKIETGGTNVPRVRGQLRDKGNLRGPDDLEGRVPPRWGEGITKKNYKTLTEHWRKRGGRDWSPGVKEKG